VRCVDRQGSAPAGGIEASFLRGRTGHRVRRNPRPLAPTGRVVPRLRRIDQREQSTGCRQQPHCARTQLEDRGAEDTSAPQRGHQWRCLGCAVPSRRLHYRRLRGNQRRLPLVHKVRSGKRVLQIRSPQHIPRSRPAHRRNPDRHSPPRRNHPHQRDLARARLLGTILFRPGMWPY